MRTEASEGVVAAALSSSSAANIRWVKSRSGSYRPVPAPWWWSAHLEAIRGMGPAARLSPAAMRHLQRVYDAERETMAVAV